MANKADKDASIPADDATYVLEAGKPIYVKTADLCAMTGKSNQWIGQLTSQGILNKEQTSHGRMYDLRTNIKSYCEMLEARKEKVDSEAAKVEADKNKAEMQLKSAKAAIAVMEANELKGKMHRSEDVAVVMEDMVYSIRNLLVSLPSRTAVGANQAEDPAQAAVIIKREVDAVLRELANYQYDPKRYEELVRKRQSWDELHENDNQ